MYLICVCGINVASFFLFDFGTVPTVWYFWFFNLSKHFLDGIMLLPVVVSFHRVNGSELARRR
jgi:hypothetical protein